MANVLFKSKFNLVNFFADSKFEPSNGTLSTPWISMNFQIFLFQNRTLWHQTLYLLLRPDFFHLQDVCILSSLYLASRKNPYFAPYGFLHWSLLTNTLLTVIWVLSYILCPLMSFMFINQFTFDQLASDILFGPSLQCRNESVVRLWKTSQ